MDFSSFFYGLLYAEDRLHLGNTKKKEFSFGVSLDLYYLCTVFCARMCA